MELNNQRVVPTRPASPAEGSARVGRIDNLDRRPINLDGFAVEDPELGLIALRSPYDPEPSLVIADGIVAELDGRPRAEFDLVDQFIADRGIHLEVAAEAMALSDVQLARLVCDLSVGRAEVARLVAGITPAKLARVVALLRPVELQLGLVKMRVRKTPSIQAHVTNRRDDPLLIGADAATAVALGFRELETTVPVLADAPCVAVALLIGSQVGRFGALVQCSIEEALELELGMRGLTNYAETVSLYGTEQVFIDGDDTPWSKAFLCSAYASRGLKMRVTSGAGSEVLMGEAERRSMLYLESRCVSVARAMGAQGVQNGGIDGASVASSVPEGMRELLAENLMVMLRDLESCSGNDTLISESDIRRTAHTLPVLLAGSDFVFSGYGSIPRYDNTFAPSNFNADDLDDYLVLQRDWGVDGGLRPRNAEEVRAVRRRGAEAVRAVFRDLGLAEYEDEHVDAAVSAWDSRELAPVPAGTTAAAARKIQSREIDVLDVIRALARTGYKPEAERLLALTRERLKGDYLQPAAIYDEHGQVLSKITDPNDYTGPGTGYEPTSERRAEIAAIRQERSKEDLLAEQAHDAGNVRLREAGVAASSNRENEVCIGLSPAFAVDLWRAQSGLPVGEMLRLVIAGIEDEDCTARLIRVTATIDVGLIGLTAARLAGSGIGVGLQAKGTAVIHRSDLAPLANLELYSVSPHVTRDMYRALGANAARHARRLSPEATFVPGTEEAITARYHAQTVALVAVERERCRPDTPPTELIMEEMP
jgi:propanediol dehydratase large subunit